MTPTPSTPTPPPDALAAARADTAREIKEAIAEMRRAERDGVVYRGGW